MSTIVFWFGLGLLCLIILAKIPGLNLFLRPVVDIFVRGTALAMTGTGAYVIWFVKVIASAHIDIIKHLFHSKSHFDPTVEMKPNDSKENNL